MHVYKCVLPMLHAKLLEVDLRLTSAQKFLHLQLLQECIANLRFEGKKFKLTVVFMIYCALL
jgi:hypothetical protein